MSPLVKVHRSAHTIGGNCIEISAGEHRIILDCGLPLMKAGGGGLAPNGMEAKTHLAQVKGLLADDQPEVSAVFISHAHPDHYGLLKSIHPDIPIYTSEETRAVMDVSDTFWPEDIKPNLTKANIQTYRHGEEVQVGPFRVKPYLMDHSAFGASAYCVSVAGKQILYTGDYRAHGRKSKCFDYLLKNVKPDIDCLIVEGTTLGGLHQVGFATETEVEATLYKTFKEQQDAAFVIASGSNIDRTISLYNATKRAGKTLVIDLYQAYLLNKLKPFAPGLPPHRNDHLRILYISNHAAVFRERNKTAFLGQMRHLQIKPEEIIENRQNMVLRLPTGQLSRLARRMVKVRPLQKAQCIYSMWQGYKEKDEKLTSLERHYSMSMQSIHVSGHAYEQDLKRLVDTLNPHTIVPIHTLNREYFTRRFRRTQLINDGGCVELI